MSNLKSRGNVKLNYSRKELRKQNNVYRLK